MLQQVEGVLQQEGFEVEHKVCRRVRNEGERVYVWVVTRMYHVCVYVCVSEAVGVWVWVWV